MKKVWIYFMMMIIVLSFVACKKNKQDTEHGHEHSHDAVVQLKIGISGHEDEPHYIAAQQFATEVETKTHGEIEVKIFGSGQLGTDRELLASLEQNKGEVDMVISNLSNFTVYEPKINISQLPFLFADYDQARIFMQGEIQAEAERHLTNHNMRVLTHYADGFHSLVSTDRKINRANDLQGAMVATSGETMSAVAMKAMGAMTKEVEDVGLTEALRQGRYTGYEGLLSEIYHRHIYQPQYYLAVTNHCYSASGFVISDSVWNGLSKEYQEIIATAAISSSNKSYELAKQQDEAVLRKMESAGVRIYSPDLKTFWEKSKPVVQSYSSVYGDLVGKTIAWKNGQ